ncbi:Multiubiquitin chain binding protein MBP1 [Mycena kentingensis (nom. inval.)]|nr:Multiubiquitin chain binding protein MBP1 [Mycena kentingensis (nom. inval.)]
MPLEATMMIIDNSEFMRNGDYQPTRFDAQSDAVTTVTQTKIDANPENTVGIMTMAGKAPEVLVTHTKDIGQILSAIHATKSKIGGAIDIPTAIAVAQLALKHRSNKNLRQRIIVFVASPLVGAAADEKGMVKLAKKLKKNNVAVDVVCYGDGIEEVAQTQAQGGEEESKQPVLKTFVENASSSENSHIITVPPTMNVLLSEALIASPILAGDRMAGIPDDLVPGGGGADGGGSGANANANNDFEFGVDPSLDPELAMALRMSMQEAAAREAAENAASGSAAPAAPAPTGTSAAVPADPTDDEEDALLKRALALSQQEADDADVEMGEGDAAPKPPISATPTPAPAADAMDEDDDDEDEEAAIARAIAMSMEQPQPGDGKSK